MNFGIFRVVYNLQIAFGRFFNLALFWHFSEHGFMKCNFLSFTEFLNNIHLNKYACIVYQRLLKALHYSDFNLLINVTALYGHPRGEKNKMLRSFIATVEEFWIWHILIQFGIMFSPFGIF